MSDEQSRERGQQREEPVSPSCEVCGYGGPLRLVTEGGSDDRWECPACAAHTLSPHRRNVRDSGKPEAPRRRRNTSS